MNIFKIITLYNQLCYFLNFFKFFLIDNFLIKTYFIFNYYILNELIWQEGLLFDFLQKKITDNWIRKFIIYSANLFNERVIFDKIIKFYIDLIIWPGHKFFIFEVNNVGGLLFVNLFIFIISFFIFGFIYLFIYL